MKYNFLTCEFTGIGNTITAHIFCFDTKIASFPCGTKYEDTARKVVAEYLRKVINDENYQKITG